MSKLKTQFCGRLPWRSLALAGTLLLAAAAQAQEFRQLNRIATPGAEKKLPAGARLLAAARPVPAASIEAAVKSVVGAWNTERLGDFLAENFNGRPRLQDSISASVPRDATLRLLSIQGSQVLAQYTQAAADGKPAIYSRVSVTVRTQAEYTDAKGGLQRLDGTNEMILLLREPQS